MISIIPLTFLYRTNPKEPTPGWAGPERLVSGRTWGGCLEVIDQLALADRLPPVRDLHGSVLLLETSELTPPADWVKRWVRSLGERGILNAVHGVLVARAPTSNFEHRPEPDERTRLRAAQRDAVIEVSPGTTPRLSSASGCRSAIPAPSGSCPTADASR